MCSRGRGRGRDESSQQAACGSCSCFLVRARECQAQAAGGGSLSFSFLNLACRAVPWRVGLVLWATIASARASLGERVVCSLLGLDVDVWERSNCGRMDAWSVHVGCKCNATPPPLLYSVQYTQLSRWHLFSRRAAICPSLECALTHSAR